jgi:hypothetical protein
MIFFIVALRAIAACLITNSHYVGIYPTDIIANGGLLGDIIFFAVSGYCLLNVKKNFPLWYGKRIWRIYLPVVLATLVYFILGQYTFDNTGFVWWFIYPTYYHFVASIVLLYIPFYFIGRYEPLKKRIPLIAVIVAIAYVIVYVFFYDKTYYHIDTVREWMIRFLFFESMLLGGYFKYNDQKFRNNFHWYIPVITAVLFVGYFTSKLAFSRYTVLAPFQIINQVLIFALLFFVFWTFASIDQKLEKLPKAIKSCLSYLAKLTLEIYVVQYVIIAVLKQYFSFPINWIVITASILVSATILHYLCKLIYWGVDKLIQTIRNKLIKKEESC